MLKYSLLLFIAFATFGVAAEPPKDNKPTTVVYDVKHLLHQRGVQSGFDKIDDLVEVLLTTVEPKTWTQTEHSLKVLSETKLEIVAPKDVHEQIVTLLEALRRQHDLIVDLHADLIEVERAYFEKEIQPQLAKQPQGKRDHLVLDNDEAVAAIRKKAVESKANATRIADGKHALYLSQRTAFTYHAAADKLRVGYHGVSLATGVQVSADRRFIRMTMTQTVTELVEINRVQLPAKPGDEPVTVEAPNLRETKTTLTVTVDDGHAVLLPLEYKRPGNKDAKTVLLAVVRPTISIGEEEREKLRQKLLDMNK